MTKVKVKICGITNWVDARRAVAEGAELLGFNFYAGSPRYVEPAKAKRIVSRLPKQTLIVGVFVNESEEKMLEIARVVGLDALQLHGDETPAMVARLKRSFPVIKAIRVKGATAASHMGRFKRATALLLDGFDARQRGGAGKTFDWEIARRAKKHGRIFLAGGLTPENVGAAIRTARPYAVDVCSGVEARPGKKDPARMKNLMRAARDAQKSAQKPKRSA
ncbi:MAG TPA: phosphoribosylanthranilate isomerase [Candidatus Acidoferrales bacterium]|jgi:phosphoribosylanthranilate isomerase|nr:phosphoribosylanthranilate isomerase [Candidatus Acidoferrales bacterium]